MTTLSDQNCLLVFFLQTETYVRQYISLAQTKRSDLWVPFTRPANADGVKQIEWNLDCFVFHHPRYWRQYTNLFGRASSTFVQLNIEKNGFHQSFVEQATHGKEFSFLIVHTPLEGMQTMARSNKLVYTHRVYISIERTASFISRRTCLLRRRKYVNEGSIVT